MSFADHVSGFLHFKDVNAGRSPRTLEVYGLALRRFAEYCSEAGIDPLHVSHDELLAFSGAWQFKRLGLRDPRSRMPAISAVREFFKWAEARHLVSVNPAQALPHPKVGKRIPRVVTLENAEKIMWAPDFSTFRGVRDAAMLGLLVGCGLRVSGLLGLNEGDVLRDSIDGRPRLVIRVMEKGARERLQPVPEQADLLLRMYLEHPDLAAIDRDLQSGDKVLFVALVNRNIAPDEFRGENRRLKRRALHELVQRYGIEAGIPLDQAHPHALRHLFGTELAEDDVPTVTASQLLGHADPKNTAIYQQMAMRKLTRVVDQAGPMSKMRTPVAAVLSKLSS